MIFKTKYSRRIEDADSLVRISILLRYFSDYVVGSKCLHRTPKAYVGRLGTEVIERNLAVLSTEAITLVQLKVYGEAFEHRCGAA